MFHQKRKIAALLVLDEEIFEPAPKKMRASISPVFALRDQEGVYIAYFCRHCKENPQLFRKYIRLPPEQFYEVLAHIESDICVEPTNRYSNPINPEHQLALTLRYK